MLALLAVACNLNLNPGANEAPPMMGGGLDVGTNGRIWVSDPDADRVLELGPDGSVLDVVALRAGAAPNRVSISDRYVTAVLRGPGQVLIIDPDTKNTRKVAVCPEPRGIEASSGLAWVACAGGELVQVDLNTATVLRAWRSCLVFGGIAKLA